MFLASVRRFPTFSVVSILLFFMLLAKTLNAQQGGRIHGTVLDPLGAVVTDASVDLIRNDHVVANTKTDDKGAFGFDITDSGRYKIRASGPSIQSATSSALYVTATSGAELNVTLGTLHSRRRRRYPRREHLLRRPRLVPLQP